MLLHSLANITVCHKDQFPFHTKSNQFNSPFIIPTDRNFLVQSKIREVVPPNFSLNNNDLGKTNSYIIYLMFSIIRGHFLSPRPKLCLNYVLFKLFIFFLRYICIPHLHPVQPQVFALTKIMGRSYLFQLNSILTHTYAHFKTEK